jgi:hypothetical protein
MIEQLKDVAAYTLGICWVTVVIAFQEGWLTL